MLLVGRSDPYLLSRNSKFLTTSSWEDPLVVEGGVRLTLVVTIFGLKIKLLLARTFTTNDCPRTITWWSATVAATQNEPEDLSKKNSPVRLLRREQIG